MSNMNSNDYHYLKEWIREKNARSLKHKIRLEKVKNQMKKEELKRKERKNNE